VLEAIGEVLAFGVGVAFSPLAVIAVVMMLAAPNGPRSAAAFVAAWVFGLAVVGTVVVLLADGADAADDGAPADWVSVVKIIVGILLVLVAAQQWRGRPATDAEPELPAWTAQLDDIAPSRAAGLALLLACVKPKNLLLTVGAGIAIAQTGADAGGQAAALAVFVVLGTLGPGVPLAIHAVMRQRGALLLTRMREWMVRENAAVIAVLCLVIAAKLLGDAISALAS
jgi:threonine/homoserine/homoserine lactone efflux protein